MSPDHVDVLIIGAGLSGIGAAHHITHNCPTKSIALLEARERSGGTWDLFRYPGIRSDSDMFTLGYSFKPWSSDQTLADGPAILEYVRETAREDGTEEKIRYSHKATHASWSTEDAQWTVDIERTDTGEQAQMTANFLIACTGYYRYDQGYLPEFEGLERFGGTVIHPQFWPEDLDYAGKRVVVIGSGATAVTVVPAMAEKAAHVTMLQRSPTYIFSLPGIDPIAKRVRRFLPKKLGYELMRWKNVLFQMASFQIARRRPKIIKNIIRAAAKRQLPEGYPIDTHFKPRYNPWDERICAVPDGDLFRAIRRGQVTMVTDHIDTFTENGIKLKSGEELEADIVVTATGLNLLALGGVDIEVDGRPVSLPDSIAYKGMMLADVPNAAWAFGYTNASWTLKCDLTCEYVCRLLNAMDERGMRQVMPVSDPSVKPLPFADFTSGYIQRSIHLLPKQGDRKPWRLYNNYALDIGLIRLGKLDDGVLEFSNPVKDAASSPEAVAA